MPIITNKHGLPEEIYRALCSNRYSGDDDGKKTDYSATTLIAPTQQTVLKRRYPDANSEDAINRLWSMFGSIAHTLLEEHGSDDAITENRFYATVLGRTISGQVDHYKDGVITDYKTTSSFKISKGSYDEWEKQLNMYAFLARTNGFIVRNLQIIAIVRDWNERDISKPNYPQIPLVIIPITLWDKDDAEMFILDKVNELIEAEDKKDFNLPMCTNDEMWATPTVWAVMKEGRKTAVKLFDTKEEAEEHAGSMSDEAGNSIYIQERKGERRRCARYCNVSSVCYQYQDYLKGITNE